MVILYFICSSLTFFVEGTPIPRELRPIAGDLAQKITFDESVKGTFIKAFTFLTHYILLYYRSNIC